MKSNRPSERPRLKRVRQTLVQMLAVMLLVLVIGTGCARLTSQAPHPAMTDDRRAALELYHEVWEIVRDDYVDASMNGQNWQRWRDRYDGVIEDKDDAYTAIRTMLASLNDNYTRFLDPQRADEQNMHIDSRLFGVGIQIADKDHQIVVVAPLEGTPADKAGIRPLDVILKIDGQAIGDLAIDEVANRIRGPKGTSVTLTLNRAGKMMDVQLVRDEITIKTVFNEPISKEIGYIRLSSFISQDGANEMKKILEQQQGTKGLIVDLRGNNGGLLPNALEITDMFIDGGEIVSVVDRNGRRRTFYAKDKALYDKPVVLLINGGSASASEIMSGALKDHHRATLIGTKTFGKGLVQKINYLEGGSELNLTISKYYTPSGQDINQKGIAPDILVDITEDDLMHDRDPQKARAIQFLKQEILASAN